MTILRITSFVTKGILEKMRVLLKGLIRGSCLFYVFAICTNACRVAFLKLNCVSNWLDGLSRRNELDLSFCSNRA